MNDLSPQNKVFGSERLRFCLGPDTPWNTFELDEKTPNLFWKCNYIINYWLEKIKMAQMIDFFTELIFKNAQNQSHHGGSLEARKPLNKNECFTTPK